jgi:hypothetical protein
MPRLRKPLNSLVPSGKLCINQVVEDLHSGISRRMLKENGGLSWLATASSAPAITALSRGDWGAPEELISAEFRGASRRRANRGLRPADE